MAHPRLPRFKLKPFAFALQAALCRCVLPSDDGPSSGTGASVQTLRNLPTASVFKLYVTGAARSYLLPWQVQEQQHWSGSGFAVGERYILTNAHVVDNHHFVEVAKQDCPERFQARVLAIAHDVDLALLAVDSESFWEGIEAVTFSQSLPDLYSEIKAVGYPLGGSTVSVTKGVVSRIDAHLYVHPILRGITRGATHDPGPVLIVQIDAAINPGNSGGPTFTGGGEVCGVSSSGMPGAQSVGYIIPAFVVLNFLREYRTSGSWAGLSEMGIVSRGLDNKALRRFLMPPALADGSSGVQVQSISPLSPLHEHLVAGDVLLEIDGQNISKEGTVSFNISGDTAVKLPFLALITAKPRGAITNFSVLQRGSQQMKAFSVALKPLPAMAPRYDGADARPSYVIVGGLVFTVFSTPLFQQATSGSKTFAALMGEAPSLHIPQSVLNEALYRWRSNANETAGLVVLLRGLKHSVNRGYNLDTVRVLRRVNGQKVDGLLQLVEQLCSLRGSSERFLYFSFMETDSELPSETPEDPDVVLETDAIAAADAEILMANGIPALVSSDLADLHARACQGVEVLSPIIPRDQLPLALGPAAECHGDACLWETLGAQKDETLAEIR